MRLRAAAVVRASAALARGSSSRRSAPATGRSVRVVR
jgi:hypothetical protein